MKWIVVKNAFFLIAFMGSALAISIWLLFSYPSLSMQHRISWIQKEKEIESRLFSIPIVLYHNIDGKGPFSIDYAILRTQFETIKKSGIRVISLMELIQKLEKPNILKERVMVITFDDGYNSIYTTLMPLAKEFQYPITLFVYTDNIVCKGNKSLTWGKLRELEREGISVESHTLSHPDLTEIIKSKDYDSKKRLFDEIYISKRVIELYMNKEVFLFAFPYGRYNLELIELCAIAGYKRVFSTDYGSNVVTRDNFCLRRHHIKKDYTIDHFMSLVK